jgi:hypothetical protein
MGGKQYPQLTRLCFCRCRCRCSCSCSCSCFCPCPCPCPCLRLALRLHTTKATNKICHPERRCSQPHREHRSRRTCSCSCSCRCRCPCCCLFSSTPPTTPGCPIHRNVSSRWVGSNTLNSRAFAFTRPPIPRKEEAVISTEAADSFTVRRAVERPPAFCSCLRLCFCPVVILREAEDSLLPIP